MGPFCYLCSMEQGLVIQAHVLFNPDAAGLSMN